MTELPRRPPGWLLLLIVGFGLAGLFGVPTAPAQPQREPAKVALVVGINDYRNRGFDGKDLKYATRDAQELGKVLGQLGFAVTLLIGDDAKKANIQAGIKKVTTDRSSDDIVIIALSGHGAQLPRRDEQGNYVRDRGKLVEDVFYCPVDAVASDSRTFLNLHDDLLSVLEDRGGINLLLVDACRDAPGAEPEPAGNRAFNGNVMNGRIPGNTVLMFSCSAGQRALETPKAGGGHGVFFHHVIEGLRGRAADAGGKVTWDHLATYLRSNVNARAVEWCPAEASALNSGQLLQSPHKLENLQTEVLLAARRLVPDRDIAPEMKKKADPKKAEAPRLIAFAGTRAGQSRSNSIGMALRWIPPTSQPFRMGSPPKERGRSYDETQVAVTLTRGFWMGEREVTQAQWQRVMGTTWRQHRDKVLPAAPIKGEGAEYPMYYVNHNEASEFARELTEIERRAGRLPADWEYRLPTEAQWEYACRAGTTGPYSFDGGADRLGEYAWYDADKQRNEREARHHEFMTQLHGSTGPDLDPDSRAVRDSIRETQEENFPGSTHPVGGKKPNGWGLHDMHGNVREWCADWYAKALSGGENPTRFSRAKFQNPTGPSRATFRVLRGGCYFDVAVFSRSAVRNYGSPEYRFNFVGFRVVAVSPQ